MSSQPPPRTRFSLAVVVFPGAQPSINAASVKFRNLAGLGWLKASFALFSFAAVMCVACHV